MAPRSCGRPAETQWSPAGHPGVVRPWAGAPTVGGMGTLRWWRTAVLATATGAALLGALTAPARLTLLGAPLVGAVSVAVVVLAAWGTESPRPSPRTLWLAGAGGTLLVPLVFGLSVLGSAGGVLLALLLLPAAVRPSRPRTPPRGAVRR